MSGPTGAGPTRIAAASDAGLGATLHRGLAISPQLTDGIGLTAAIALVATAGKVVVPVVVQRSVDSGLLGPGGVDGGAVAVLTAVAAVLLVVGTACSSWMNARLVSAAEAGLDALRRAAFDHAHRLSAATQQADRRGALVSRVTNDVDALSLFVARGGLNLVVSMGQVLIATVVMVVYSWQLTLVVWAALLPVLLLLPRAQRAVARRFATVRVRMGALQTAVSEAVLGGEAIASFGAQRRASGRLATAIAAHRDSAVGAQVLVAVVFSGAVLSSAVALAAVVVVGTFLGGTGALSVGTVLAFVFLVQLFIGPVQQANEMLNELQNAVAGWRRVLAVLETPVDVVDPGAAGIAVPPGPVRIGVHDVRFAYPGGRTVLHDVSFEVPPGSTLAVVGPTGSGKTTLAVLLARLADPTRGAITLNGVDLRDVALNELRQRVCMVPQDAGLLGGTVLDNIGFGRDRPDPAHVDRALAELGLTDWAARLPHALDTEVGNHGSALSAGERQLVALARAHLTGADVLILDEATSAVDPVTEVRLSAALEALARGRTTVTVAHRLSTAHRADLVAVVDDGRLVEFGSPASLWGRQGTYRRLHDAWTANT